MKIILVDVNPEMIKAWEKEFRGYKDIEIIQDSIFNTDTDIIVSPANSFGEMGGGLDTLIKKHFGSQLEDKVQDICNSRKIQELLVGECVIIETGKNNKYLMVVPTMRIPMDISDGINVYMASKTIFNTIKGDDRSIAIPGLGTGTGRVSPEICAKQMRVAYDECINGYKFKSLQEEYNKWISLVNID